MRLLRSDKPSIRRCRTRMISKTENGRRSNGSLPRPGLDHDELSWLGRGSYFGSSEGDDVVIGREARVLNDPGLDIEGHWKEYTLRCATSGC